MSRTARCQAYIKEDGTFITCEKPAGHDDQHTGIVPKADVDPDDWETTDWSDEDGDA